MLDRMSIRRAKQIFGVYVVIHSENIEHAPSVLLDADSCTDFAELPSLFVDVYVYKGQLGKFNGCPKAGWTCSDDSYT